MSLLHNTGDRWKVRSVKLIDFLWAYWRLRVFYRFESIIGIIEEGYKEYFMLTIKQERFVLELVKGKSQRDAYKSSYSAARMKDSTVDEKACRLFSQDKIRARYEELMKEAMKPEIDDAEAVRKMILETEMAIATANMGDLFEVIETEDGSLVQKAKSKASIEKFDMRAVKSYRFDSRGRIILELYDKQPAIQNLREMLDIVDKDEKEEIRVILEKAGGYDE